MKNRSIIIAIAGIEIAIGLVTISGLSASAIFSFSTKSPVVFSYVIGSAAISAFLGMGLLSFKDIFRKLLIFFSGYVILIKIMVFLGILEFAGELVTVIASPAKNAISILYHAAVILILHSSAAKALFKR